MPTSQVVSRSAGNIRVPFLVRRGSGRTGYVVPSPTSVDSLHKSLPAMRAQAEPMLIAPHVDSAAPLIEQAPQQRETQMVKPKVKDSPAKDDWARGG